MTLVTLSAAYGAGGSRVGPAVAERLDLPFVDRAIPPGVAERLALPLREAVQRDESVGHWLTRALLSFGQVGPVLAGAAPPPAELVTDDAFRAATEQVLHELAVQGAVVLGRAGALVLGDVPGALHVRLDGPPERRVAQAMELEGLSREDAERLRRDGDRAREAYVRHFYGCDARNPALYHLVIDSTVLSPETTVEVIAAATGA